MSEKSLLIHVITDCTDANAQSRYITAFHREFEGAQVNCVPIKHLFEGILCAIDTIDEFKGKPGIVFLNSAPRKDSDKEQGHLNGKPFVYFFVAETLVITSDESCIWGLFKKIGIPYKEVRILDLEQDGIPSYSQFRSCHCVPLVAKKILDRTYKGNLHKVITCKIEDSILYIDNFGNIKTTLTKFSSMLGPDFCKRNNLADAPEDYPTQIIGSSGYKEKRFIELVIKGDSLADEEDKVGNSIYL